MFCEHQDKLLGYLLDYLKNGYIRQLYCPFCDKTWSITVPKCDKEDCDGEGDSL